MKGRARADHTLHHLKILTWMIKIKVELPFYKNNFKLVQSERFQFIGSGSCERTGSC